MYWCLAAWFVLLKYRESGGCIDVGARKSGPEIRPTSTILCCGRVSGDIDCEAGFVEKMSREAAEDVGR